MDEESSAGINGSDGGLAAGVASKKKKEKKKSWMFLVLFPLLCTSVGAACCYSRTHERMLRKDKTI